MFVTLLTFFQLNNNIFDGFNIGLFQVKQTCDLIDFLLGLFIVWITYFASRSLCFKHDANLIELTH